MLVTEARYNWLRGRGVTFSHGPGFSLPDQVAFEAPCALKHLVIDHSSRFGAFSYGVSGYLFAVQLGRYTSMGENISIGRHNHHISFASTSPYFQFDYRNVLEHNFDAVPPVNFINFIEGTPSGLFDAKITTIEHDVWIGHGAFISPGVTIGTGAVIAAHAVVTKDVPPYAVVAGVPAQIKKYRFDSREVIDRLLESKWWEFAFWQLDGARIHNVENFLNKVQELRDRGTVPYKPAWITASDILAVGH